MTLSNPCSIGNARAAALCLVRIGNEKRRPLSSHVRRLTYHVCGSFMDNKESRFQLFLFLYMSPQPAASSRVSRSLTVSLSPALNCSVEFAATGQIHVVSCCPHQVSVPQRRRDSNLYASAPHRGSSRGEACQQGYCCLHQQAREHYGVSLPALVRKPDQYSRTGQQ